MIDRILREVSFYVIKFTYNNSYGLGQFWLINLLKANFVILKDLDAFRLYGDSGNDIKNKSKINWIAQQTGPQHDCLKLWRAGTCGASFSVQWANHCDRAKIYGITWEHREIPRVRCVSITKTRGALEVSTRVPLLQRFNF